MRMIDRLEQAYSSVVDADVSVSELYVYSLIISDDRSFNFDSKEIEDLITKVLNSSHRNNEPLAEIVDRLLDGDSYGDYDDEEGYDLWI